MPGALQTLSQFIFQPPHEADLIISSIKSFVQAHFMMTKVEDTEEEAAVSVPPRGGDQLIRNKSPDSALR